MADFDADQLVSLAKERYGEALLRGRMRGAQATVDPDQRNDDADAELGKIAASVISRVKAAAIAQVSWPFPPPYNEVWPENLLQNALDLFNWRTVAGLESASDNQRRVGMMAESYFEKVQGGGLSLGIGGDSDTATPEPVSARNRDGSSNLAGVPDRDNNLDIFTGLGWDRYR